MRPKKLTAKRLALIKKDRRHRLAIILFPIAVLMLIMTVLHFWIEDFFLLRYGVCHKAIVTEKFDYHRGHGRTHEFVFSADGKSYYGDSRIQEDIDRVGDTIAIVYLPVYPRINRAAKWFDGELDCE